MKDRYNEVDKSVVLLSLELSRQAFTESSLKEPKTWMEGQPARAEDFYSV